MNGIVYVVENYLTDLPFPVHFVEKQT